MMGCRKSWERTPMPNICGDFRRLRQDCVRQPDNSGRPVSHREGEYGDGLVDLIEWDPLVHRVRQ
jgi:hypothetical protein